MLSVKHWHFAAVWQFCSSGRKMPFVVNPQETQIVKQSLHNLLLLQLKKTLWPLLLPLLWTLQFTQSGETQLLVRFLQVNKNASVNCCGVFWHLEIFISVGTTSSVTTPRTSSGEWNFLALCIHHTKRVLLCISVKFVLCLHVIQHPLLLSGP